MWTRGTLRRNYGVDASGLTVHPRNAGIPNHVIRTGPVPLTLPRPHVAMDPSNPQTWQRPVRFT